MLQCGDRLSIPKPPGNGRDYTIRRCLGKGGFGVVYEANDDLSGKQVAIKVLEISQSWQQDRVKREIKVHAQLSHPSIVGMITASWDTKDRICIVMEYCSGGDLNRFCRERGAVSEDEARDMFVQVAQGVAYLHKHGISHRDLSLGNILLTADGKCKICDFGLAVEMRGQTQTTVCGTPNAMSPQVASRTPYDGEGNDIWGLGVIMYTLLVGKNPFDDGKVKSTLENVQFQNPDFPPTMSPDALAFCNGMLQKDLKKRFTLQKILEHPFLLPSTSSLLTSADSGFGTLSSSGPITSTRLGLPDSRKLASISEASEERRTLHGQSGRPRSATPIVPQHGSLAFAVGNALSKASTAASVEINGRPRSASLDRGSRITPGGGGTRTATAPPVSSPSLSLAPPIKAWRLKPQGKQIKQGIRVDVLTNGKVQIEVASQRECMTVTPDGAGISVERTGQGEVETYTHDNLPRRYWKKYNVVAKCVQRWREVTPKVTLFTERARSDLMENEPVANFQAAFYDGVRIEFCSETGQFTYRGRGQRAATFPHPLTLSSVDKEVLGYLKDSEDWRSQCTTIDKLLTDGSHDLSVAFPCVIGRRPRGLSTLTSALSVATTAVTTAASAPLPAPSTATSRGVAPVSAATNVSHVSRYSQKRGEYRRYPFDDGTLLELPKDTNDERFRYRNKNGQWETNEQGASNEMQNKIDLVLEQQFQRRSKQRSYSSNVS